jgi:hypothetical protein
MKAPPPRGVRLSSAAFFVGWQAALEEGGARVDDDKGNPADGPGFHADTLDRLGDFEGTGDEMNVDRADIKIHVLR